MECGPQALANAATVSLPSRRISSLIGTMTRLCSLRQSFLVQSTEELLAHSISTNVNESISTILGQQIEALPNVHHAILCVGTKIVSIYKKPKSQRLSSQDLFLLTLLFSSHFEPYHLPKQAAPGSPDEEYAHLHRPLDITSQVLTIGSKHRLIELVDALEVAGIEGIQASSNVDCAGPIIKAVKRVLVHAALHEGEITPDFDESLVKTLIKLQTEYKVDPAAGQLCLATLKAIVRYVIYPSLPEVEDDAHNSSAVDDTTGSKRSGGKAASPSVGRPVTALIQPSPQVRKVEHQTLSELDEAIIAIRYLVDDRPKVTDEEMNVKRVYQTCFLSSAGYKPGTVYFARFLDRITLLLLSNAKSETVEEKNAMIQVEGTVQNELASNGYNSYILSMESSYTMVAYMHMLPGLVHFILVDRTLNRFIAPEIAHLGGDMSAAQIKKHVWHMCYQATEFLSKGAFEMVQTNGPFQYSYKMLFMDHNNTVIHPRESRAIEHKAAVTRGFYKHINSTLFPNQNIKCYELFCLYIGSISLKMIQKHNDTLISILTKKS